MYKSLLNQKALLAFNMLKDLAEEATFSDTTVTGFDFDNGTIEKVVTDPVIIKMVPYETKKKDNTITKSVIARLVDTGILDEFDLLTFQGKTWNIGPVIAEAGQVVMFEIFREGS